MFCTKCGNEIPGDYVFCPKCGTPTLNNKNANRSVSNCTIREPQVIGRTHNKTEKISKRTNNPIKIIAILIIGAIIIGVIIMLNKENPKTQKILNYVNGNSSKEFSQLQSKMVDSINDVLRDKSKGDQDLYNEVSSNTIVYAKQLSQLANDMLLEIDDEDIRNIQRILIDYSDLYVKICTKIISAIDNNDSSEISEVNEYMGRANKLIDEYWSDLTILVNKNGVSIKRVE